MMTNRLPLIIYPNGRFIVVKNYLNPAECFVYRGHSAQATVAKFSPNGFWVASADITGKVRVWSWDNPEHLTKLETAVFSGAVFDLDWDVESKKLVAVGDGSGTLVKCFTWDTGNSAGDMNGHIKRVTAVAYKPTRPFRVMSGGEDFRTVFYAGPPFKLDHSNESHSNFINSIAYTPNGAKVVSVSTDKKIQVYDGATGQPTAAVANAHDGGIYSVSFSPDGARFATASADKTVKIWNTETLEQIATLSLSNEPQLGDMQVAVVWTRENLLSVSLNGNVNVLSTDGSSTVGPVQLIQAHQCSISASALDRAAQVLYTGSIDGVVCSLRLADLKTIRLQGVDKKNISGAAHSGKVAGLAVLGDNVLSVGWDDKLRLASTTTGSYHSEQALTGQPTAVSQSSASDLVVVLTVQELAFYRGSNKVASTQLSSLDFSPVSLAVLNEDEVALGGGDHKTRIFALSSTFDLSLTQVLETSWPASSLLYSPAGDFLALGGTTGQVEVFERGSWEARVKGRWSYHTSKITALTWSPDGQQLMTGALDENIYIYDLPSLTKKMHFPFTHPGGVTGLHWVDGERFISTGGDAVVVVWKLPSA
eukprot:scaffold8666_cov169-Ochromonas_danica.AAC.2